MCAAFVLLLLPFAATGDPAGKVRIIDADTWDVGGERVRLFGIDAPERGQTCQRETGRNWACGDRASQQVRSLFGEQSAVCESLSIDRYGRTVARCTVGGNDVGRVVVRMGWAVAYRKYSWDYDLDEKAAHMQGLGIHQGQFETPADFRAGKSVQATQAASEGCRIKGNVSARGERIYHLPGQVHYGRTRISLTKGERWFCSESDATLAGWRRAKR